MGVERFCSVIIPLVEDSYINISLTLKD